MIDLHNHILPGVDDGARDMEEAVAMARMAVADGIHTVVATPHVRHPTFHVETVDRDRALKELNERLTKESIPLTVLPGAEIHLFDDLLVSVEADATLALGGGRWILLEWPNDVSLSLMKSIVFDAQIKGMTVLLAHAERHPDAKSETLIADLVRAGLKLQINADSLTRRFTGRIGRTAKRLIRDGHCHVLASDAHDVTGRPPRLTAALAVAKSLIGPQAESFVMEHPASVL